MTTTHKITEALGRARMAKALGVGMTAISNAVVDNRFPAAWFDTLDTLARDEGVECPRSLFNFRTPAKKGKAS